MCQRARGRNGSWTDARPCVRSTPRSGPTLALRPTFGCVPSPDPRSAAMSVHWLQHCNQRIKGSQNVADTVSRTANGSNWMKDMVHNTVLAQGRWCHLDREAEIEQVVGLDQRPIRIGDRVGLSVQHVQGV